MDDKCTECGKPATYEEMGLCTSCCRYLAAEGEGETGE